MTKYEFLKNEKAGKYIYQNALVRNIDVVSDGIHGGFTSMVEFQCDETPKGEFNCKPYNIQVAIPFKRLGDFLEVFNEYNTERGKFDIVSKVHNSLSSIVGCYARLCIYEVPDDEMHQLSDKYELVAVRNIVFNRDSQTYVLDR